MSEEAGGHAAQTAAACLVRAEHACGEWLVTSPLIAARCTVAQAARPGVLTLSVPDANRCGTEITGYSPEGGDDSEQLAVHLSSEGAAALHAYGQSGELQPALATHAMPDSLREMLDRRGFPTLAPGRPAMRCDALRRTKGCRVADQHGLQRVQRRVRLPQRVEAGVCCLPRCRGQELPSLHAGEEDLTCQQGPLHVPGAAQGGSCRRGSCYSATAALQIL